VDGLEKSLTGLLQAWGKGDLEARDRVLPIVYDELRRQAARYLRRERAGHTLQPTALVHEAYLRLVPPRRTPWQGRTHFFAAAAQAMRRILVDHARRRASVKRAGDLTRVTLEDDMAVGGQRELDLLALDEALERLAALDSQTAQIVEFRFFGGLSIEETASVLGVSPTTVKRDWSLARAWLHRQLKDSVAVNRARRHRASHRSTSTLR
jgi:RNA polymerase sigma factor (TIGR02999 family)